MNVLDRFRLEGRVALVTGASHGIGEGIALALAGAGADVALAARGVDDLERVAGAVRDLDGRPWSSLPTSLIWARLRRWCARTVEGLGEPEILFNVAGVNRRKPILDVSLDDWNFVLDVNLRGLYFASQAVARRLVARQAGWGRIVHIASMTSYRGFADLSLYALTKTAVISITRSQAVEWAEQGIRVNAIAPGWIETPMTAQMNAEAAGGGGDAPPAGGPTGRWRTWPGWPCTWPARRPTTPRGRRSPWTPASWPATPGRRSRSSQPQVAATGSSLQGSQRRVARCSWPGSCRSQRRARLLARVYSDREHTAEGGGTHMAAGPLLSRLGSLFQRRSAPEAKPQRLQQLSGPGRRRQRRRPRVDGRRGGASASTVLADPIVAQANQELAAAGPAGAHRR